MGHIMWFRSKNRRERAIGHAEDLVHQGREKGESLLHRVPEMRGHLEELREQAQTMLRAIEDLREQAEPAVEEGKESATHAAIALAAQVSPRRGRSKRRFLVVGLLVVGGGVAYFMWKRRDQHRTDPSGEAPHDVVV